jgi:hypothetical protein
MYYTYRASLSLPRLRRAAAEARRTDQIYFDDSQGGCRGGGAEGDERAFILSPKLLLVPELLKQTRINLLSLSRSKP